MSSYPNIPAVTDLKGQAIKLRALQQKMSCIKAEFPKQINEGKALELKNIAIAASRIEKDIESLA